MRNSHQQPEFTFDSGGSQSDGLASWRQWRENELSALARRIGLPIGHLAEVWLKGGIRLKGVLRLYENHLILPEGKASELHLQIDGVSFRPAEMESCVRAD